LRDPKLYTSLMHFPVAEPFIEQLCHRHNWPSPFARRAIDEYKRFVYLSMVSPHALTPSDDVDRVWRLHLLHTRSYEALNRLLPRPLAYKPLAGGDWSERTRIFYLLELGQTPPPHLWTPVPVAEDWTVPDGGRRIGAVTAGTVAFLLFGLWVGGPEELQDWLHLFLPSFAIGALFLRAPRSRKSERRFQKYGMDRQRPRYRA
jgi:hypothetical protein